MCSASLCGLREFFAPWLPLLISWSCSLLGSNATAVLGPGAGPASKNNPLSAQYPLYLFIYFKLDPFPDQTHDRVSCGGPLWRGRWHFPAQALSIPTEDGLVSWPPKALPESEQRDRAPKILPDAPQAAETPRACSIWWTGPCYYAPKTSCVQGMLKSIADVREIAYRLTDPSQPCLVLW